MYSLRIDGAKVRNADSCHTVTHVSPANIVPLTKKGNNRKRVVKGKTSTICTATQNRLVLLNEREMKNETEKNTVHGVERKKLFNQHKIMFKDRCECEHK